MIRNLLLVRHGQTEWNVGGRLQGREDIHLNELGRNQARDAATILARFQPTRLVSSDLTRARETTEVIAPKVGLEPRYDERLREINIGSWGGLTRAEVAQLDPEFPKAMAERRDYRRSATGEKPSEVGIRVAEILAEELSALGDGETGLIISHGMALRMGTCEFVGFPDPSSWFLETLDNCHWGRITEKDGEILLTGWNLGIL